MDKLKESKIPPATPLQHVLFDDVPEDQEELRFIRGGPAMDGSNFGSGCGDEDGDPSFLQANDGDTLAMKKPTPTAAVDVELNARLARQEVLIQAARKMRMRKLASVCCLKVDHSLH